MNIPIQFMQSDGEFSVPGTRQTVNSDMVRRALRRLPLRDRDQALGYIVGGSLPSDEVAEALRRAIVQVAEQRRERVFPRNGKNRSQTTVF